MMGDPAVPHQPLPHVLVVEDEPVIASLLADVLGASGYRVTQRHRVDEAIAVVRAIDDFALCISDFMLPDRTGLDFAREVRVIRPSLRIVLASAFLEPEVEAKVEVEPSIAMIVRKPLDIFDLKGRVDRLTGRTAARAPSDGGEREIRAGSAPSC
jgi:DNA-binding response OmpR family regulator